MDSEKARRGGGSLGVRGSSRVVDQHVESSETFHRQINTSLYLIKVADITRRKNGATTPAGGEFFRFGTATDEYIGPRAQKDLRYPLADPFPAAGYDDGLASEIQRIIHNLTPEDGYQGLSAIVCRA